MSSITIGKASLVGAEPAAKTSSDAVRDLFQLARDTAPAHRPQAANAYTQLLGLAVASDKDVDPKIKKQAAQYASAIKLSGIAAGFKATPPTQSAHTTDSASLPGTESHYVPAAQTPASAGRPPPVPPRLQPPVPPRLSALAAKPNSTRALADRADAVATALAHPLRPRRADEQTDDELLAELERGATAAPSADTQFSAQDLAELAELERELPASPKVDSDFSAQDLADLAQLEAMLIAQRS